MLRGGSPFAKLRPRCPGAACLTARVNSSGGASPTGCRALPAARPRSRSVTLITAQPTPAVKRGPSEHSPSYFALCKVESRRTCHLLCLSASRLERILSKSRHHVSIPLSVPLGTDSPALGSTWSRLRLQRLLGRAVLAPGQPEVRGISPFHSLLLFYNFNYSASHIFVSSTKLICNNGLQK